MVVSFPVLNVTSTRNRYHGGRVCWVFQYSPDPSRHERHTAGRPLGAFNYVDAQTPVNSGWRLEPPGNGGMSYRPISPHPDWISILLFAPS